MTKYAQRKNQPMFKPYIHKPHLRQSDIDAVRATPSLVTGGTIEKLKEHKVTNNPWESFGDLEKER